MPAHKQGGTVAYATLIAAAPAIVACYHSKGLRDILSRLVGVPIRPTPIYDQSSLSVLVYDKPATISAGTTITTSTAAGISLCCWRSTMPDRRPAD